MISFPNAKINLGLNVVEKRPDGFHNLETVFYPIGLCDALEIVESGQTKIKITGIELDSQPGENLVLKAYHLLESEFGLPPVAIHLHKAIPFGAGLGGGSSDAAFMLKLLNDFFSLNLSVLQLETYASRLGSDCAFFIRNKPAFACGKGEQLFPATLDLSSYSIVLIKPSFSVSTAEAYSGIKPCKPGTSLLKLFETPINRWRDSFVNDFEIPVAGRYPEITRIKKILYDAGAIFSLMTGSGSAVFGIFETVPSHLKSFFPSDWFFYR